MAQGSKINQRLSGINPLAYLGNDSYQPPEFVTQRRAPTTQDRKNFQIGALWLDTSAYPNDPAISDLYMLVALSGGSATWITLGGGDILNLTGNSGGPVAPDSNDNINVVGDGTNITIVGDPGTNTLTASLLSGSIIETLTGDSGGAVGPTAGNIDVVGSGVITVVGNPGTSTLTVTPSGDIASSFITNPATGTATPVAGVLTFAGTGGITVTNAGSTVTIDSSSIIETLTGDSGGAVAPTAGNIDVVGSGVITVVGNPGASSLTVTPSGDIASSFITNPATGTATPAAGVLTFAGTGGITVTNAGSTVTIDGGSNTVGLTADDANTVTDTAGIINITGGNNIATTGTSGPNTLTVNLDGITQYSVQVGGSSNSLTQIPNGTTGQVLTAVTGGDPVWQTNAASTSSGSFTPVLNFGGATTGITYSSQTGTYFQLADLIFFSIKIGLTSKGSATGAATITGLPFTVLNVTNPTFESFPCSIGIGQITLDTNYDYFMWRGTANTTTGELIQWGSGQTEIAMDDTNFINTSEWTIQGWYQMD